ncbi:MAG: excalibur calcium-binding domain-containing protein [Pseudomonas sp.]|uniref:excalibur calcium-binding domain-containing protein n=1 Tax=Pseudomonas sp. TaxID=306 RepID=UPI001216DA0D|nr:excalibur calcium-binding domain-containing protein [Pseudomonas sp.]RZI67284.1 MAG: excalibur calcium-binding domain-containing protein [Pseudomonas sp.]
MRAVQIWFALAACTAPSTLIAHPGGLNSEGCHNNRKTGDYHCHRGGSRPAPAARVQRLVGSGGGGDAYYANCAAVRAAGAAPIRRGQRGYRPGLDRDGDGIGCE